MKLPLLTIAAGVLGAAPALAAPDLVVTGPVVELPPMIVTSDHGPTWRHAEIPGYEILSCCPDTMTADFMHGLRRAETLLQLLVPHEYWAASDVPRVIILSTAENLALMPGELLGENNHEPSLIYGGERLTRDSSRVVPNLELGDQDCSMVFATLDPTSFDRERFLLHPAHVRDLLANRRPGLPEWVVAGVMNLYSRLYQAGVEDETVSHEYRIQADTSISSPVPGIVRPDIRRDTHVVGQHLEPDTFSIPALEWISKDETTLLRKNGLAQLSGKSPAALAAPPGPFLPMPVLFAPPPQPDDAAWPVWNSQATLFVRWASDEHASSRKQALWRFVGRTSSGEPASEELFREEFGTDFNTTLADLQKYLLVAIRRTVDLHLPPQAEAVPAIRPATKTEIIRLKEDWARLVAGYLRTRFPGSRAPERPHRAAVRACENGDRDPRLLAAVGLYELDLGRTNSAKKFLEAATDAKVVRPRAYYELARLRYAAAERSDGDRLTAGQAGQALAPLAVGLRQTPYLRESLDLGIDIALHSGDRLPPEEISVLDTGIDVFPDDLNLLYEVALLNRRQGNQRVAESLAARGLQRNTDPDLRLKLRALIDH